MQKLLRQIMKNHHLLLILCALIHCLGITGGALAELNDVAIYHPGIQGGMSIADQEETAVHLHDNISIFTSKTIYAGYEQAVVDDLATWMTSNMSDGHSDLLIIIDIIPAALFQGETDDSLAEQWMDNGNMLLWTGSEPFANSIFANGEIFIAGSEGAKKVLNGSLDISSSDPCGGTGLQKPTTAVYETFYDYTTLDDTMTGEDKDGYLNIAGFVEYTAEHALRYDQLFINDLQSDRHRMSYWRIDEIFAEDSENYQSDNIIIYNDNNGRYGQFYTTSNSELNSARKEVIAGVLNNWVGQQCRTLVVDDDFLNPTPDQFNSIQSAVDVSRPCDTILVKPGLYNEQLNLGAREDSSGIPLPPVRGVKIVSDGSEGGNEYVTTADTDLINANIDVCVQDEDYLPSKEEWRNQWLDDGRPGHAESYGIVDVESKKILKRTARTIIYGTGKPGGMEGRPMIDFALGSTVGTVLDGFTICEMPRVNHEIPGHAHVVQTRGGSATIINNFVYRNGSSGLGSHAWFKDQQFPRELCLDGNGMPHMDNTPCRDFRYTNISHDAHPILINNIVARNEGNNLGNNHYSYAIMHNNELIESISVEDHASPGIGCQHGAHPLIDGNIVYKSDWVGIGGKKGLLQGVHNVNRPTHPIVRNNYVLDAGENVTTAGEEHGAGIGADDTGGFDPKTGAMKYHIIENNYVVGARNAAIGVRSTDPALGFVKIIGNEATRGGNAPNVMGAGIGINGAHAVEIRDNTTYANSDAGIGIRGGGSADLIADNTSHNNGMAGIGMKEGADVGTITGNTIYGNKAAGIGHNGLGPVANRVTVAVESHNRIYNNELDGIGIQAADIGEISHNVITGNQAPGIALVEGTSVHFMENNILDGNGTNGNANMAVLAGSSAFLRNTTLRNSGSTNMSIAGPGTMVTMRACILEHSEATNLEVRAGAQVTVHNSTFDTTRVSPNLHITDPDTVFTMIGGNVMNSARPGLQTADYPTLVIRDTVFDRNGTDGSSHLNIGSCTSLDFDNVTVSNSQTWSQIYDCNGRIRNSEFHDIAVNYTEMEKVGGMLRIMRNSTLDIEGNVFHHPGWLAPFIRLEDNGGSTVNVYHNTLVGRAELGGGWSHSLVGTGLSVGSNNRVDARNNIFLKMPQGIGIAPGSTVTASTNCFFWMGNKDFNGHDGGIFGDNVLEENPYILGDFSLINYSPLIDRGEHISGVNDDYLGYAPDLGAKESPWLRPDLFWTSPKECFFQTVGGVPVPEITDENTATACPEGDPVIICRIDDHPMQVYGVRFSYAGFGQDIWDIKVSSDLSEPFAWTDISRDDGVALGTAGPGEWREWSADHFYPGAEWHYIKFSLRGKTLPADTLHEIDLMTRGDLMVPEKFGLIQAAIDASMDGDYIYVNDGVYSENIDFRGKAITVQSLNGPESTLLQTDGTPNHDGGGFPIVRFVNGEGPYSILDGFTLTNQRKGGYHTRGVYIATSSPTLRNCIIRNNELKYDKAGAGIIVIDGGLTLIDSIIDGNSSAGGSGLLLSGKYGNVTLSRCTFSNNIGGYYGRGGAISLSTTTGSPTISISDSFITGNSANLFAGGIYVAGAVTRITNTTISNNTSPDGGGIGMEGNSASITIADSTVSGNSATASQGIGGGIAVSDAAVNAELTITGSAITGNSSAGGGGVCLRGASSTDIINTTLSNNSSENGGAILLSGASASATVEHTSISNNFAGNGNGGGISVREGAHLTITSSGLAGNQCAGQGGGIWSWAAFLDISKSVLNGNMAGSVGGIALRAGTVASIVNTNITGNVGGGGAGIKNDRGTLDMVNSTVSGNASPSDGGGMYHYEGTSRLTNCIVWGNVSVVGAAGIHKFGSTSPVVAYSDIQGGYAGTGNINLDPTFSDFQQAAIDMPTQAGNFHIQIGSPVIDMGTSAGAPVDDIDGDPRPLGAGIEMGSDEWKESQVAASTDDCLKCHADRSSFVNCRNKQWLLHLRKNRVNNDTYDLAERTYAGVLCRDGKPDYTSIGKNRTRRTGM